MAQSLMDFFSGTKLTELIQSAAVKRGVPRKLPEPLFAPSLSKPTTDKVEYISYRGNRQGARAVARSSPSRARELPGAQRKYATAINVKETMSIGIEMLDALKSDNVLVNRNAQQHLVRDFANFRSLFENSRTNAVASMFANGAIYLDKDGNQLATSGGAYETVGSGIATAQQISVAGGGVAVGDFSVATTNIGGALRTMRDNVIKANNYELTTIIYGTNVPDYLAKNTTLKEYFARHQETRAAIVGNNEIPNGTLGFNWQPVHSMYFNDQNDSQSVWFGPNFIGAMPDVSDDWYEFVEGGNLVPKGVASPTMTIDDMIGLVDVINGMYSFAEMAFNPLSVNVHMGDSFIPLFKNEGVYLAGVCA